MQRIFISASLESARLVCAAVRLRKAVYFVTRGFDNLFVPNVVGPIYISVCSAVCILLLRPSYLSLIYYTCSLPNLLLQSYWLFWGIKKEEFLKMLQMLN